MTSGVLGLVMVDLVQRCRIEGTAADEQQRGGRGRCGDDGSLISMCGPRVLNRMVDVLLEACSVPKTYWAVKVWANGSGGGKVGIAGLGGGDGDCFLTPVMLRVLPLTDRWRCPLLTVKVIGRPLLAYCGQWHSAGAVCESWQAPGNRMAL